MKNNPFIYIRGLRKVDHTVFAVNEGQKYYIDPQFGKRQAYSSGQQVKRSIIEGMGFPFAAITFNWEITNSDAKMKQPYHLCNPEYVDQLIGGYMKSVKDKVTVKRRSPLSISAMTPLHPLLGGLENNFESANFDRKNFPAKYKTKDSDENTSGTHNVRVFKMVNKKEVELTSTELDEWLNSKDRQLPAHYYKPNSLSRATGLYTYDIAIDLRTLFCVSRNKLEPELYSETEKELLEKGWIESENVFGKCLVCPEKRRKEIINRLVHAIINWRITSNQSRTFSLMETLALAISTNANKIAYAIRAELKDDYERPAALPVIDENSGADLYLTPLISSIIPGFSGSSDALDQAEEKLKQMLLDFDYVNQI